MGDPSTKLLFRRADNKPLSADRVSSSAPAARLVIISNRVSLPRERVSRAGGLAVALKDTLQRRGGIWFGWSGELVEEPKDKPDIVKAGTITYATMPLTKEEHRSFYVGYANSTLWPLCHYRLGLIDFRRAHYVGYMDVNRRFAAALMPMLQPDDVLWVHDYHFIPMASELRKLGLRNRIGFFLHIPFPAHEVMAALPYHRDLLRNLADYDLVGVQTESDVKTFCDNMLLEADGDLVGEDTIKAFGRTFRIAAFPIGIDTEEFKRLAQRAESESESQRLVQSLLGRKLVIGVDRLDYSKGLPNRFEAFQQLLASYPEHRNKVTFLQIAPVSRDEVAQYRELRRELEALAGRTNGSYAEFDWMPLRYLNKSFPRRTLAGFYRASRIGMVTPLRDGMNLVAKEYVAAQDANNPGVLILSRFAGAARELDAALVVNPYDVDQLAQALDRGLRMPLAERQERWRDMMDVLERNTIVTWRERFLRTLQA